MTAILHPGSFALARAMCEARGWSISNLALQKSMYIADMVHMGRHGAPITAENFEAWDYGPVLPSVYERTRIFGSSPVEDVFPHLLLAEDQMETVSEVALFVSRFTPGQLVNLTHSDEGAWSRFYRSGERHIPIPKIAEADEFRRRQARSAQ